MSAPREGKLHVKFTEDRVAHHMRWDAELGEWVLWSDWPQRTVDGPSLSALRDRAEEGTP